MDSQRFFFRITGVKIKKDQANVPDLRIISMICSYFLVFFASILNVA